jgi:F-type H+-transporting ATPase subunit delta
MTSFTRPYAKAFVDAAPPGYDFVKFLEAGDEMARAFAASPKLRAFLLAPNVPREAKSRAVGDLASKVGMDEYGARFLQVMLHNHRLLEAGAVFRALRDLYDELQNVLRVHVTVPGPLNDGESQAIEAALMARTGKKVKMQIDYDPALLGGFVARAGSRVFDGSVAAAIRRFQEQVGQTLGA